MTQNNLQKKLIDALITTHQDPSNAFKKALKNAQTQQDSETLHRIAQAYNIKLNAQTMETTTTDGARLVVEIDTTKGAGGWLILTEYDKAGKIHSRNSITGDEFAKMWEKEYNERNNPQNTNF